MQSKNFRWYGVITLFVIVAISYVDRINIAVLITDAAFLKHVGIDASDRVSQGLLATAFMLGYGISAFVLTPFCSALFGVRRSLIYGLVLWGVVTWASPMFNSYGLLLASRVLLGVSEGPLFSLASSYIKAHFQSHENGKPNALVNMGTGLGLAVGYPLVGYLLTQFEWDSSFHVLGVLNIVLGIPLVLAFVRMPAGHGDGIKPSSLGDAMSRVVGIVKGALHTRHLFLITLLTSAALAYLWGSSNWLPTYLREARGFSLREMGWIASLPQYATVLAVFTGGVLIDKLGRDRVPFIFMGASAGVALSVLLAINARDPYMAATCLVAANFFWGLQSPAIPSTVQHCSRPEHTASAFGVTNGVGSLVAGFMPALMGGVISAVSHGSGAANTAVTAASSAAGFFAGFALLIGTQVVVFACGFLLWWRERGQRTAAVSGSQLS
ncbi:MFS family permease [Variovorax boronicumulans]|uniref:MFS family permease n=1 Tax=Variovorax boronicumulans TaxID=436515 RepID=A0AAW8DW86_9BURK|nr:MFS transporter [Variovorax boronicumulans]MDP9878336.1 MFS family permease [Variovorax boronicumulans]MDP9916165.1 MFS family permease [Variovorax boronicumulans]MDP9923660.1 MFS family permease [Variovorax boronicumulans]PBI94068.1 putative sulfoacetate transporter SauU [Variovorax boronicumulans]